MINQMNVIAGSQELEGNLKINKAPFSHRKPVAVAKTKAGNLMSSSSRDSVNMEIEPENIHTQRIIQDEGLRPIMNKKLRIDATKTVNDSSPQASPKTVTGLKMNL